MAINWFVFLVGFWASAAADKKHCPELRSLLVNEANWYESKKYCESRGLRLAEVEPGDGPGGILADYLGRSNPGRQWHGGHLIMAPECTTENNFTCRPLNCTMLTGDSLINVSCSEKAQAACRFIQAQENGPEPYPYLLVRFAKTWVHANSYCRNYNMTLVVILDEDKQRHLVEYLLLEETTEAGLSSGDYYIGLRKEGWIDGSSVSWANFIDNPSDGRRGVLRISEMIKWDWNDGSIKLNFICEKHPSPHLIFGLASSSVDGPGADRQRCTAPESISYSLYRSSSPTFLLDNNLYLYMYDSDSKLGYKYEFRIWIRPSVANEHIFRVRITTYGKAVSCNEPQTVVYTAAEPSYDGCCGKQIQCKHIGDIEVHYYDLLKSCIYECECVDVHCRCSHLVIRFYYVPWLGDGQLSGGLYHLVEI